MTSTHEPYLKAAGSDRLTRYYDLMARLGMRERRLKNRVIDLAQLAPGQRLLDLGCGTGTLVLMAHRRQPDATVIGVDGDPTILGIARRKARRAGIAVQFDEGMAYALPYADGSFDSVVSTLMFHHLTPDQRQRTLAEVRRVLRPGGRLVIGDLARPHNRLMRLVRRLTLGLQRHGSSLHAHGALPAEHPAAPDAAAPDGDPQGEITLEALLATNGWRRVAPAERQMSLIGTIAIYALARPE
ncbi:MAG TPA: class I SAM-dependent methyltransferase [Dehalococcoidia bacterium]|nr:class I SAM-dependent methyltransferase [Dehalococcoidia bacterium]